MTPASVRENLEQIQEKIAGAAARAGRRAEDVTLIAVSKTHPASAIREAYEAGIQHFGENRVEISELSALTERIADLPQLELAGLMCVPPFLERAEQVRPYFRRLRELSVELSKKLAFALPVLSIGMSHDFEVAIEEGATEVRVGTAIFGTREAK